MPWLDACMLMQLWDLLSHSCMTILYCAKFVYQLDSDLKEIEKQIDNEYQKELKIIDEKFQYLKEKSTQYESYIKNLQKLREESFQKMLQFAQQIKDGL